MTSTEPAAPATSPAGALDPALDMGPLVAELRRGFGSGLTRPLPWRQAQLRQLIRLLVEGEDELVAALHADLGKPAIEGWSTDLAFTRVEVEHTITNLARWATPERVKVPAVAKPGKAAIHREPLGVALVIAPWNYPVQLLLLPMAAAIAAGNAVVGKPSELAPATSAALARLVPRYLDERAVAIVEGGVPETTALLAERFDHIFYTGNGRVGRVVMRAAAEHLTPVTLELGGKSPVIVDRDADLEVAARRVTWGKFLNAGQTCVAPDHVLVHRAVEQRFTDLVVGNIKAFYGADPQRSEDFARIVNRAHHRRLSALLDGGGHRVVTGGQRDEATRYLAPTVVADVTDEAPVMGEELFGPILPILAVDGVDEAMARVNAGDKPLALYAFTASDATADTIVAGTSSGGVCVNGVLLQLSVPGLPFGGVGESGTGSYHGRFGFDTFSHAKAVLTRGTRFDPPIAYPPYKSWKAKLLRKVL